MRSRPNAPHQPPVVARHRRYFSQGWNYLDFVLVATSVSGFVVEVIVSTAGFPLNPQVFRVLRIARVTRALKAVRMAGRVKGIAKLLDTLNTGDRRLTVLLFSDHGEGLGHFSTETHGEYLYEPLVRVPYLLWTSDQRCDFASVATASPGPRSTGMTPRLILQRFGLDAPTTPPGDDATIFMSAGFQAAVIVWPHKLIVSPWFVELYDLSQDPSETVNVAASSPEIAQTLTSAISGEGLIDP